ncbi:MFS transporter [Rhodococcus sp. 14-2470-1a]|uniref:MFS transporter n=1 Tax=Rhodococcus sp. 14-2470-1a TaxID=2023150 RepID=UPI0015C69141|nr:MFS transporter [Rhodococcus sp. 14-2470-1a]
MNVVSVVQNSRMSVWQYVVVGVCFLGNLIDGFELAVMGFALPQLPGDFATTAQKGWLAGSALIGMGLGALFLAPQADRYGRRSILILASALSTAGMIATALSPNVWAMFGVRILTGIGVGAVGTLTILVAQEYSSLKQRNMSTAMTTIGYAVGAFTAGSVGLILLEAFGGAWQGLFLAGSVLGTVGLIAMILLLPESLAYLVMQDNHRSRAEILKIAHRMHLHDVDPGARSAESTTDVGGGESKEGPFGKQYRTTTVMLTFGYTMVVAAYYFVANWTPQLVKDATGDVATGAMVGTIVTFGGILGAVVFGFLGMRIFATKIAWIMLAIAVVSQVVFALTLDGPFALIAAALLGMGGFAAMSSYMAATPPLYPTLMRGKALGSVVGISRIGSILTPIAAGYLVAYLTGVGLYLASSILFAMSAITAFCLWLRTRSHFEREGERRFSTSPTSLPHSDPNSVRLGNRLRFTPK